MPANKPPRARGPWRVLVSDPIADTGIELLRSAGPALAVEVKTGSAPDQLKRDVASADALIVRSETKVTADVIAAAPRLKVVGRAGVGVDNIDLAAATRRGILVLNAPEGNTIAAAEHAMAMLLAMARNIPAAQASLKGGEWKRSRFTGRELYGKVLGVVGLGRIGREVAKRARAFGMTVVGTDPLVGEDRARELGIELATLKALVRKADFISLHAALTPETRHLLGAPEFAAMKRGVRIVNCARGGLLDERALAAAITSGRVAGAALDVFEAEPPPKDHPLFKLDGVVVTPHLGASTEEAQTNVSRVVAEQVRDYLLHGTVRNAVNAPAAPAELLGEIGPYLDLAERMGRFLIQLTDGAPKRLELDYHGEIAKRDPAPFTASAVRGVLSHALGDRVNVINAATLARDRGIAVQERRSSEPAEFSSLIRLTIVTAGGNRTAEGSVMGKGEPHLVSVDGLHLDIVPAGAMITFTNVDRPGIVGRVGTILGRHRVNIAGLHLGRVSIGKRAVSIFSVDPPVPPAVLKELAALSELSDVRLVEV